MGSNFIFGIEVDLDGIGGNNERGGTAVTYDARGIRNVLGVRVTENGGFAGDLTGRLGLRLVQLDVLCEGRLCLVQSEPPRNSDRLGSQRRRHISQLTTATT